jgi:aspartyl-tRNA(Asn)/glutamyl-tRNA(Gln) amidotransferase subunit C
MKVDKHTVDKIAHLARLEFDEKSKEEVIHDINRMLQFVEKLNEVDTEGVEPLIYMNDEVNVLREDDVIIDISQKDALKNAPKKDSDYFKVPKMIDQSYKKK